MKCTVCGEDITVDFIATLCSGVRLEHVINGTVTPDSASKSKVSASDVYLGTCCRCTRNGYRDTPTISKEDWDALQGSILDHMCYWSDDTDYFDEDEDDGHE